MGNKFIYVLLVVVFNACIFKNESPQVDSLPLEPNLSITPNDIITSNYKKTASNHVISFENLSEDSIGQGFVLTFDSSQIFSQYWILRIEGEDEKSVEKVIGKYAGTIAGGNLGARFIIKNLSSRRYFTGSTLKKGKSTFLFVNYEFIRSLDSSTW